MASFTDQLIAFNPYIQQIPVDDYVRVGMIKQQQYNEGVQKVQGYIDSVAGLEVIKPEQKDYLQQRVNNLQQEVGKVVQADFSSQQLVNSIGALTNRISSDPIIQTAVASTQSYKQGIADIKSAREKGKSSISNEWDFHNQFQKWYADGDATTRFQGTYTPYTDVNKKILDAIKELKPNVHIEDIPYKRLPGGDIEKDESGRPIIDMAMMEKLLEGVSPERIQAAINANVNADDINQLAIDGRYAYRGVNATGMKEITDKRYTHKLDQVNDIIQGLIIERQTANNDPQKASLIDAKIQAYKDKAIGMQNSYRSTIGSINSNLEAYKGNFYTSDWSTSFSDAYAYAKESLTYKENPYFMAAERRRENDIRFQEYMMNKQFEAARLGLEEARLGLERERVEAYKLSLQTKGSKAAKGALEGIPLSDAILEPIPQGDLEDINVSSFLKETQAIGNDIDQQKMALLGNTGLVVLKKDENGKNPHYEYNVAGKDPNTVIKAADAAVAKLKDAYDRDPNSVDQGARTYFQNLANADQVIQNRRFAVGNLQKEADATHSLEPALRRISPITLSVPGKGAVSISREQQLDFNNKLQQISERKTGAYGVPYYQYNDAIAEKLLVTPEEKHMYQIMKQRYGGSEQDEQFRKNIRNVEQVIGPQGRQIVRARDNYMNNAVRDLVGIQQPVSFTLEAFEAPDRKRAQAVASRLVNTIIAEDKSSPNPRYDEDDIKKMLGKQADNTTYSLVSKGRGRYALGLSNTEVTGKPIEMDITKQQAEELFGQGKFLDDFYNIRQSLQLSKGTAKWTTDVRGLGKESAFNLNNGLLNKYSMKYHVEDPLKNGGLQVRMYIYDKQNKQWLPEKTANFGQLLNEAQVTKFLSQVGDQYIDAALQTNQ